MMLCRKWMLDNRWILGHTQGATVEAGQGLLLIPNIPTAKASQGKAHRGLLKVTQLLTGRTSTCLITQTSPCLHGRAPSGDVYTNDNHPEIPSLQAELAQVHGENPSWCLVPLFPVTFQSQKVRHLPLTQNKSRGRRTALVTRAGDVTQKHQGYITVKHSPWVQ